MNLDPVLVGELLLLLILGAETSIVYTLVVESKVSDLVFKNRVEGVAPLSRGQAIVSVKEHIDDQSHFERPSQSRWCHFKG